MKRVEIEATIKHMPLSLERQTVLCKNDIAQCKNFDELKASFKKNDDGKESPRYIPPPVRENKKRVAK